jgi:hypothetical protein
VDDLLPFHSRIFRNGERARSNRRLKATVDFGKIFCSLDFLLLFDQAKSKEELVRNSQWQKGFQGKMVVLSLTPIR